MPLRLFPPTFEFGSSFWFRIRFSLVRRVFVLSRSSYVTIYNIMPFSLPDFNGTVQGQVFSTSYQHFSNFFPMFEYVSWSWWGSFYCLVFGVWQNSCNIAKSESPSPKRSILGNLALLYYLSLGIENIFKCDYHTQTVVLSLYSFVFRIWKKFCNLL